MNQKAPKRTPTELLYLLQVVNSSFPTGAFNHSYGFETLIEKEIITDSKTLETHCRDWLLYGVAPVDGAAVACAYRAALADDLDKLLELDNIVGALKLPREVREASYKTGGAFLNVMCKVFKMKHLVPYAEAVANKICEGHHAVAFGVAATDFGIPESEAVLAFFQSAFSNLVGVAARLIPLGQVETQRIIAGAWPLLNEAVDVARSRSLDELGTNTAYLDIAGMHHERLYSRLCMS
jgi:urease accessory protein